MHDFLINIIQPIVTFILYKYISNSEKKRIAHSLYNLYCKLRKLNLSAEKTISLLEGERYQINISRLELINLLVAQANNINEMQKIIKNSYFVKLKEIYLTEFKDFEVHLTMSRNRIASLEFRYFGKSVIDKDVTVIDIGSANRMLSMQKLHLRFPRELEIERMKYNLNKLQSLERQLRLYIKNNYDIGEIM